MMAAEAIPPVDSDETLARYVTQSSQFRKSDQTVKPDVFIPHPHADLSVTRHRDATIEELWEIGRDVANALGRHLYGRADICANVCTREGLTVSPAPLPNNSNHADISNWPTGKPRQKLVAMKLAEAAGKIALPPSH